MARQQDRSLDEQPDGGGDVHPGADLRMDVSRALNDRLSEGERRLLAYRYWLDYTDRQIADALGIPLGTAKIRLHRARRKLEAALA